MNISTGSRVIAETEIGIPGQSRRPGTSRVSRRTRERCSG